MQSLMNTVFPPNNGVATPIFRVMASRAADGANVLAVLLAFFGMLATSGCIGYAGNPAATSKAGLHLTPNAIDFGSVGVGSNASQPVIVANRGAKKLTLTNISAMGSEFSISGFSGPTILQPGQTMKLTAVFAPTSAGPESGNISVTTASQGPAMMATLKGKGATSLLSATPSPVDFGNVSEGSPSTQTLKLTDEGAESLVILSVSVSGKDFSVSGLTTPQTLTPKQSVTLTAKFDPRAAGAESGNISVVASGGAVGIGLNGVGIAPNVQLVPSTTAVAFGNVTVGKTVTQQVTLKSMGNSSADISNITVSGSGYSFSGMTPPMKLEPNQSALLTVNFDPKTAGSLPGTVTINSNAPNSPLKIGLSGDGTTTAQPAVELKWEQSPSPNIVGYYVYRSLKSGGSFSKLNSQADSGTSYTDNTVANGNTYIYVVTAVNSKNVQSPYSSSITVSIPAN
jgi:Abnormal spindle-like microcephaly-assoc'd, ASPM-SPD-2-Hydin/Transmembrane protein 131-like N-terminal